MESDRFSFRTGATTMANQGKKGQSDGLLPQADEDVEMVAEEVSLDQHSSQARQVGKLPEAAGDAMADAMQAETDADATARKLKPAIDRAVPDSPCPPS
jgi:hypothetical protein